MISKRGIEYQVHGEGEHIILIENGLGCPMYDWEYVIDGLKEEYRIITYHRRGYGESKKSESDRNTVNIVAELKELLDELGINTKISIIAHSFGGLCAQHFIRVHPELVKDAVFVDTTSTGFQSLYELNLEEMDKHLTIEVLTNGWMKIADKDRQEYIDGLSIDFGGLREKFSDETKEKLLNYEKNQENYRTCAREMRKWKQDAENILNEKEFPNIPLTVIARDLETSVEAFVGYGLPKNEAERYEEVWSELIKEQRLLSIRGKLIQGKGCDHQIQIEQPELIINAVRDLRR